LFALAVGRAKLSFFAAARMRAPLAYAFDATVKAVWGLAGRKIGQKALVIAVSLAI
jgi:hypothetical protein